MRCIFPNARGIRPYLAGRHTRLAFVHATQDVRNHYSTMCQHAELAGGQGHSCLCLVHSDRHRMEQGIQGQAGAPASLLRLQAQTQRLRLCTGGQEQSPVGPVLQGARGYPALVSPRAPDPLVCRQFEIRRSAGAMKLARVDSCVFQKLVIYRSIHPPLGLCIITYI